MVNRNVNMQPSTYSYDSNTITKTYAVLLLMVLIYLLLQAVFSSMVYFKQYYVNTTLDSWYENIQPVTQMEWDELESFAVSSMNENESNTTMLHAIGRVYDYRSSKMAKDRKEKIFYGQKSIGYYRQVIQMRPAWPYGWMNLALAKVRLGKLDDEYKHALIQLLKTGAWEKQTLPSILRLSLFSWYNLDNHSHQLLLDYFLVAQDERTDEVHRLLQSTHQLELYCKLVVVQRDAKARFCK